PAGWGGRGPGPGPARRASCAGGRRPRRQTIRAIPRSTSTGKSAAMPRTPRSPRWTRRPGGPSGCSGTKVARRILARLGSRMSRLAVVSRADHEWWPRLQRGDAAEVGSVGVVEDGLHEVGSARGDEDERAVGGAVHPHDGRVGDATVLDVVTIVRACRGIEHADHDQRPDGALHRLPHGGGRRADGPGTTDVPEERELRAIA